MKSAYNHASSSWNDRMLMLARYVLLSSTTTVFTGLQFLLTVEQKGMLLYNTHNYWNHTLVTAADLVRVIDDLGRFRLLMDYLHDPFCGLHGSFLLVNGAVMNHVTWNTDCLVEDYWLALEVQFPTPPELHKYL